MILFKPQSAQGKSKGREANSRNLFEVPGIRYDSIAMERKGFPVEAPDDSLVKGRRGFLAGARNDSFIRLGIRAGMRFAKQTAFPPYHPKKDLSFPNKAERSEESSSPLI